MQRGGLIRLVAGFAVVLHLFLLPCTSAFPESEYAGKRILYIDSYHAGWPWNERIADGIRRVLEDSGAELRIFYMDTKRNTGEAFKREAGRKAARLIEEYRPDVVIASDDSAAKYVIAPYFIGSSVPFVFCGINWDPAQYGFPTDNVTGMVEINLVDTMLRQLKKYIAQDIGRIGYLASDTYTERQDGEYYRKYLGIDLAEEIYVTSYAAWKKSFIELQKTVDILIVGTPGLADFDYEDAERVALEHTQVPTGAMNEFIMPYALLGYLKVPEEFGIWAARTALRILDGVPAREIPMVTNRRFDLILNLKIADRLGIVFSTSLLKNAVILR